MVVSVQGVDTAFHHVPWVHLVGMRLVPKQTGARGCSLELDKYDVVVVGAGPGGSIAARTVAEKGARVLLLERDAVIGQPVRCGEGVVITSVERFTEIDERWVSARISGVILYAPDGTPVPIKQDREGLVLERAVFDRRLAEQAADAGADVLTCADADGLVLEKGAVKGVYYMHMGRRCKVESRVVIGADGVESRIGRWAGIRTQCPLSGYESAYQMMLSGIEYDHNWAHFYLGNSVAPGGYAWVFPKGERTANVGLGVQVSRIEKKIAYEYLSDFVKRHFPRASIVGQMAGGVPVSKPLKKPYGNGIMLVGDAARLCNPLTGAGIWGAMLSGEYAGLAAVEAVDKGDVSEKQLSRYAKMIGADIVKINTRSFRVSQAVLKLSDEVMNRAAAELSSQPVEQMSLRKVFLRTLTTHPKLAMDIARLFT